MIFFIKNYFIRLWVSIKKKVGLKAKKKKIFLSHSGKDKKQALKISNKIKIHLKHSAPHLEFEIFNTSDPEFRFVEFKKSQFSGHILQEKKYKWKSELEEYLKTHLSNSDAYLLLVTKRELLEGSEWIEFEMRTAKEIGMLFIPCFYSAASYKELPKEAESIQGVDLTNEYGFHELVEVLIRLY